ncbi:MAG: lycopene beta-cyclase CrtY [Chitinophagaceae bacterium]|nr:lycopene beta-cyclase CrtY [Oligoflexus sp.]
MAGKQNYDVIFIGGGLAAALAALLLKTRCPTLSFVIVDSQGECKLPQTWSFQSLPYTIDPTRTKVFSVLNESWLQKFVTKSWSGYSVRFPSSSKDFSIAYHSIRSADFWTSIKQELGDAFVSGESVSSVQNHEVVTQNGKRFHGRQIIDARGWAKDGFAIAGYQKFLGLTIRTAVPHGVSHPILMDATVPQVDGFRFLYTLPWTDTELLIEDTRYSNGPDIDDDDYRAAILAYAHDQGYVVKDIVGEEKGVLPLPSFSKKGFETDRLAPHIPQLGVRGGFFHPTTGYSIYDAVLGAEQLLESCEHAFANIGSDLIGLGRRRWDDQEFYRRLNNMLFFAAEKENRYQVLERFYEHDNELISRFYAGATSTRDKFRILLGRPPIPIKPALFHFFNRSEVQHV